MIPRLHRLTKQSRESASQSRWLNSRLPHHLHAMQHLVSLVSLISIPLSMANFVQRTKLAPYPTIMETTRRLDAVIKPRTAHLSTNTLRSTNSIKPSKTTTKPTAPSSSIQRTALASFGATPSQLCSVRSGVPVMATETKRPTTTTGQAHLLR